VHRASFDDRISDFADKAGPPPSDLKWVELTAFLKHLGYKQLNGSGSRRKKEIGLL
jgi:hypothetical protein